MSRVVLKVYAPRDWHSGGWRADYTRGSAPLRGFRGLECVGADINVVAICPPFDEKFDERDVFVW